MLQEMQAKLGEAIGLYGQILDGQQAYAARRYQEEQQRRYQQQMYAYAPPQQQYSAYAPSPLDQRYTSPLPNGHASPYAQQPVQQYWQAPQPAAVSSKAAPSLYPSMPSFQPQPQAPYPAYQPAQQSAQSYPVSSQPSAQPYSVPSAPYAQSQPPQLASSPPHPGIDRSASLRLPSAGSPPQIQRHQSMTYGSVPHVSESQGYNVSSTEGAGSSAPPPVDMASHPSSSPTLSVRSALPGAAASAPSQGSYASPQHAQAALPTSSAPPQPQAQSYLPQIYAPQHAQQQQPQQQYPYQHAPQQQQPYPTPQQQHVYNVDSFPAAPGAVFPDAPSGVPEQGLEKQEKEEALLIEL